MLERELRCWRMNAACEVFVLSLSEGRSLICQRYGQRRAVLGPQERLEVLTEVAGMTKRAGLKNI
jgi:hypothetical protein